MKRVLRCFEVMSGLKINFHKSAMCGVRISDSEVKDFAEELNCKTQKLPMMYLGLPVGANPRRKSTWQSVVDKVRKKFSLEEKIVVLCRKVNFD